MEATRPAVTKRIRRVRAAAAKTRVLEIGRWRAVILTTDLLVAAVAGAISVIARFGDTHATVRGLPYVMLAASLPLIWAMANALAGSYDARFLTSGPDMF